MDDPEQAARLALNRRSFLSKWSETVLYLRPVKTVGILSA